MANPRGPEDFALKEIDLSWEDGGAYALLGPSGCGKSTLLNIMSGLVKPSHGRVLFNDEDVTDLQPDARNIAQVFQFPVIYDTMTVYDNLAFPLRNRGVDEKTIRARVHTIAEMLEVVPLLSARASGLSPDNKQKISMGRGLVREDVNVVMFDEPLTVIDPHLKWKLRSKLKELHHKVQATMIYVTHDQTEALTFADKVVVMQEGEVVQIGTPVDLFERPEHTFVGHFIGSPGMNVLPCGVDGQTAAFAGHVIPLEGGFDTPESDHTQIGVRPEYVSITETGLPATVRKVADIGRHIVVEAVAGDTRISAVIHDNPPENGETIHLTFQREQTRLYCANWLISRPDVSGQGSAPAGSENVAGAA